MSSAAHDRKERVDWLLSIPFILMHLVPLAMFWLDFTWVDITIAVALYYVRMFFVTGGYHRYFAHRGYKLKRWAQFLMAFGAQTSAQKGALWWAGHHRHHHKFSDTPEDIHTPKKGLLWSHITWIMSYKYQETPFHLIKDFAKYPELVFLNKWHWLPPFALAIACFAIGGWTGLVVWFFFSTVLLFHGTFLVNSLAHIVGQRRYVTTDTSRNSFMITFFTLGEGWHNNHHHYAPSARNGFYWWEIDITYYVIRLLELVGVAYDVRGVPKHIMERNRVRDGHFDVGLFGNWQQKAAQARQHAEDLRKQAGEFAEELMESTRKSAGEIVENTRKSAEELVILSKGPMGVKE